MYPDEIDILHKAIDEKHLSKQCKEALHNLIERFFTNDYQGISKKHGQRIKVEFEFESAKCVLYATHADLKYDQYDKIVNQIEISFLTILDKSIDKMGILERILRNLPPLHFSLKWFKSRSP